jgi:hypothetical protein
VEVGGEVELQKTALGGKGEGAVRWERREIVGVAYAV